MPHSGRDVASFTVPGSRVGHADTPPPRFSAGFRRECGPQNAGKVTGVDTRTPTHTQSHSDSCSQDWRQCCGRLIKAWHAIDYTPTHIKQKGASPAECISRHSSGQALTQQPFRASPEGATLQGKRRRSAGCFFFCKVSPFLDSSFGCLQEVFQGVEAKGPLPLPPALPLLVQQV